MSDIDTDSEKSFRSNAETDDDQIIDDDQIEDENEQPEVDDEEEHPWETDWEARFDLNRPVFEDLPILSEFTDQELDLLPLSYIRGPLEQWSYIYDAVKSDFKSVANLGKVNDRTLRSLTDVIRYSYMKKNSLTEVQKAILRYEIKRLQ